MPSQNLARATFQCPLTRSARPTVGPRTHLGEWHGLPGTTETIPASGKPVTLSATDIYLIRGSKIVEDWKTLEQLDVLSQIGALPGV